ncbi:periplasmic phosphate binding protein [Azotobacter vinelandii CA]|uniref:Periplasmic phosphate binding protein n=3 Tax=Azotobacter group TaxID=351 RepID=C1DLX3_AZOVD|nr:periplasmic phosphate binding protein [Azotobacter vinelandii DJ]AGK14823.1 periplasmic phosphate binding protein [Azotobacter vinelandii CA]AGK20934.1 periplasmic phosphate binding protein [Azotobacter vinelandii CA6]
MAAAQPVPAGQAPVLRIQGSNTIGAELVPALVAGLFEQQGLREVRIEDGESPNERRVLGLDAQGRLLQARISAHGSGTGFAALRDGSADIAASSRPIKDSEAAALAALGDMRGPQAEQVIAIDGLAVILHPDNPLRVLGLEQVARVFAGEVKTWEKLGGRGGPIRLYARDARSGTFDTFHELVLEPWGKTLDADARRFESSAELSASVSRDPAGIGFIGLPYVREARALAISAGESRPMPPEPALVATEDYPLSRRLFLYERPRQPDTWSRALIEFAQSPRGQELVERNGFVAQKVQAVRIAPHADMPPAYQQLARHARRLSVNFRFQEGSALLDNKALRDVERVLAYLREHGKLENSLALVGFGDPKQDPERSTLLSKLRALAVRRELARGGATFREIIGLGDALPVADNGSEEGRLKNRRVEVWVH